LPRVLLAPEFRQVGDDRSALTLSAAKRLLNLAMRVPVSCSDDMAQRYSVSEYLTTI